MRRSSTFWQNFLFDLDGTLVNSSPIHERAFRATLGKFRVDLLPQFSYPAIKAKTTREAFRSLGIVDEAELDEMVADKQRSFRDAVDRHELGPMPCALELLADLKRATKRLFVVSSGSGLSVSKTLEATGLARYFEQVITADDVERGKPAPDAFLLCLSRFALDPTASVVVEDAKAGVMAARDAGLAVIAVHDHSIAGQADIFLEDFATFRRWLTQPSAQVITKR